MKEPIPELATPSIQVSARAAMEVLKELFEGQARAAVEALTVASMDAGAEGLKILGRMSNVAFQVGEGELDRRSGAIAIDMYLESLRNRTVGLSNLAQAQAFARGVRALAILSNLALGFAEALLAAAVPGASRLLIDVVRNIVGSRGQVPQL
jgi:hypothetical protein